MATNTGRFSSPAALACDFCGGRLRIFNAFGGPLPCPECNPAPSDADLDAAWLMVRRGRRSQTREGRDLRSLFGLLSVAAKLAHAITAEYPVGPDLARNLAGVEWAARTAAESLTADGRAFRPDLDSGSFSADVRRLADELAVTECDEPAVVG